MIAEFLKGTNGGVLRWGDLARVSESYGQGYEKASKYWKGHHG